MTVTSTVACLWVTEFMAFKYKKKTERKVEVKKRLPYMASQQMKKTEKEDKP